MNTQDFDATGEIRDVDGDLAVKATRTEERRVEDVGTVRRRDDDDTGIAFETIHFGKKLVQGLFALVVTAADAGTTGATDGVDFVDEDDARGVFLRLLEEIADAGRTDTDEHFNEFRTRDGEERDTGFTGDRLGEQSLTRTRRTDQKAPLRDLGADGGESLRTLQELDNLHEIVLSFLHTGNVIESDASVRFHLELGLGLAERHGVVRAAHAARHAAAAALLAASEQEQTPDEQERERQVAEQVQEHLSVVLRVRVRREINILFTELLEQLGRRSRKLHAHALHAVTKLRRNRLHDSDRALLVQINLLHPSHVEVLEESRVRHARRRDVVRRARALRQAKRGRETRRHLQRIATRLVHLRFVRASVSVFHFTRCARSRARGVVATTSRVPVAGNPRAPYRGRHAPSASIRARTPARASPASSRPARTRAKIIPTRGHARSSRSLSRARPRARVRVASRVVPRAPFRHRPRSRPRAASRARGERGS